MAETAKQQQSRSRNQVTQGISNEHGESARTMLSKHSGFAFRRAPMKSVERRYNRRCLANAYETGRTGPPGMQLKHLRRTNAEKRGCSFVCRLSSKRTLMGGDLLGRERAHFAYEILSSAGTQTRHGIRGGD
jgi:hypothetical protein